jgi:hypothetical protein
MPEACSSNVSTIVGFAHACGVSLDKAYYSDSPSFVHKVDRFRLSVHDVSSKMATYSAGVRTMTPPLDWTG